MDKLTKVGLSALAGSLAMVSAHSVEYALTGDMMVKYASAEGDEAGAAASNGKGLGVDNDLYVNASGELDNGWTVSAYAAINLEATTTSNESSVQLTIGMGSLGTIEFADVWGASSWNDDVSSNIHAYEEPWDSTSHTRMSDAYGADTQSGSVSYLTPSFDLGGVSASAIFTYDPNSGSGPASPGGTGATSQSGHNLQFKLAHADSGITVGGGQETSENTLSNAGNQDEENTSVYIILKNGPFGAVYQEVKKDEVSSVATIGTDYSAEIWGISFAQGNWAVSYVEETETKEAVSDTAAVEAEMTAINASYTMGAMSIKGGIFETTNPEWVASTKYEETEIALSFAF